MTEVWLQEGREGLRDDDFEIHPVHISGVRVEGRPPETNCLFALRPCGHRWAGSDRHGWRDTLRKPHWVLQLKSAESGKWVPEPSDSPSTAHMRAAKL